MLERRGNQIYAPLSSSQLKKLDQIVSNIYVQQGHLITTSDALILAIEYGAEHIRKRGHDRMDVV